MADTIQKTLKDILASLLGLSNSDSLQYREVVTRLDGIASKLIEVEMEQRVIVSNQAEEIRMLNVLLNAVVEPVAAKIEIIESDPVEQSQ